MRRVVPYVDAVLPQDCERARAHASLALDCELSELERAWLRTHLADCESCDAFVAGLREVTHELRAAPLPEPSRPLLP
jgi:predicted anti-sigma-YlaC factor YlaD